MKSYSDKHQQQVKYKASMLNQDVTQILQQKELVQ